MARRQPCKRLISDLAYLGRYCGQPVSEVLALPVGLRFALVSAVIEIVKEENPKD
jgi:hypothetical protein